MKRKHKKEMTDSVNCYFCEHCVYVGQGGYICSKNEDIVIDDWEPAEDFFSCNGRSFE